VEVKKQPKMGAHLHHHRDGSCRHGHCLPRSPRPAPPRPPRLAQPCPGSPPRAAMVTARCGLLAPPQPPCTAGLPPSPPTVDTSKPATASASLLPRRLHAPARPPLNPAPLLAARPSAVAVASRRLLDIEIEREKERGGIGRQTREGGIGRQRHPLPDEASG
jgi:hypothetical protein